HARALARCRSDALRSEDGPDAIVAAQRRRAESRGHRSTAGPRRAADEMDRCRHAQRHRLSRGVEMRITMQLCSPPSSPPRRTRRARGILFGFVLCVLSVLCGGEFLRGQSVKLDPALLGKPPIDAWPTYNGDYSGRRFSTLKQITTSNVKNLTLAWVYRLNTSATNAIVGGEGPAPAPGAPSSTPSIKSTPLMLNGMLYLSAPDHVWAIDARTGRG